MSDDTSFPYDFDPYAENDNNVISAEAHTITAANGTDFNFIVPRYAPFFRRGFTCVNATSGVTLRPDIDYFFGFRFDQIIVSGSQLPVYGAIVFNDKSLSTNIQITYHTLGGEFSVDDTTYAQLMANKSQDPRSLQWGAVVDLPTEFPPIAHRVDSDDVLGFSEVIAALNSVTDGLDAGNVKSMQALLEHIADHNNPHEITLAQLGIDNLGNLIPATKDQAEAGVDNVYYMTSLRVAQQFNAIYLPMLEDHENDTTNPHKVTAAQVGLDQVPNYRVATALEATAAVADNVLLTAAGGRILASALVPDLMTFHTSNTSNPHSVTATQVGLGNVQNYALATEEEALAGVSKTTYLTPYLANLMFTGSSDQPLAAHIADHNNPHQVTASQVGLGNVQNYATSTNDQALQATRTDLFLTPANLGYWWTNSAKNYVDQAVVEAGNVTAEDIGLGSVVNAGFATDAQNAEGTATQVYVDPAGVTTALANKTIVRDYTASPGYIAQLITGFPAEGLINEGSAHTNGMNNVWSATMRTVSSPLQSASSVSMLLVDAPSSTVGYNQRAKVDVATATSIPGFIFGYYTDTDGNDNLAGIFFKEGACYLGTYIGGTWTNSTDTALADLTGSAVEVSILLYMNSMSVTAGGTVVTIDVSSVTFSSTAFESRGGFVVVGADSLTFTPTRFDGLSTTIVEVISSQAYKYEGTAWSIDTEADLSALATDLRVGREIINLGTGEYFICLPDNQYGIINPPSAA